MSIQFSSFLVLSSIALLLLLVLTSAHQDAHGGQAAAYFSYSDETGPEHWGSLSPAYVACSNGKTQSPIDLKKQDVVVNKSLKPLLRNYTDVNATLVNNGNNIGVHFDGEVGGFNLNGKYYALKQIHWHSPAEHLIEGQRPVAELHLVHKTEDGSISVIAVLYKLGSPDPIIKKVEGQLGMLPLHKYGSKGEAPAIALGIFDVRHLRRKTRKYYRYVGSLTTPPCTESVIWNVLGKVRTMTEKQVELLKTPLEADFKHNARPAQPLNGRRVEVFSHPQKRRS